MRQVDAKLLKSFSDISIIVLGATFLIVALFFCMKIYAVLTGTILNEEQFFNLFMEGIICTFCYQAIVFISDFQDKQINPALS